jgi:hypothetical protein
MKDPKIEKESSPRSYKASTLNIAVSKSTDIPNKRGNAARQDG